jgi:hypothetical protein
MTVDDGLTEVAVVGTRASAATVSGVDFPHDANTTAASITTSHRTLLGVHRALRWMSMVIVTPAQVVGMGRIYLHHEVPQAT